MINELNLEFNLPGELEQLNKIENLEKLAQISEEEVSFLLECLSDSYALVKLVASGALLKFNKHLEEVRKILMSIHINSMQNYISLMVENYFNRVIQNTTNQIEAGLKSSIEKDRIIAAEKLCVLPIILNSSFYLGHLSSQMIFDHSIIVRANIAHAIIRIYFINDNKFNKNYLFIEEQHVINAFNIIYDSNIFNDSYVEIIAYTLLTKTLSIIGYSDTFIRFINNLLALVLQTDDLIKIKFIFEKICKNIFNTCELNELIKNLLLGIKDKPRSNIREYLLEEIDLVINISDIEHTININCAEKDKLDLKQLLLVFQNLKQKINSIKDKGVYLFLGHKKSGKSLLIGSLMGAKFKKHKHTRLGDFIYAYNEKEDFSHFPELGYHAGENTTSSKFFSASDSDNIYIDNIMDNDNKNVTLSICASLAMKLIIDNKITIKGVVVVVDYPSLKDKKSEIFKELMANLNELFVEYNSLSKSVLFLFNRVHKKLRNKDIEEFINKINNDLESKIIRIGNEYFFNVLKDKTIQAAPIQTAYNVVNRFIDPVAGFYKIQNTNNIIKSPYNSIIIEEENDIINYKNILELIAPTLDVNITFPLPKNIEEFNFNLRLWEENASQQSILFIFDPNRYIWLAYAVKMPRYEIQEIIILPQSTIGKKLSLTKFNKIDFEVNNFLIELQNLLISEPLFPDLVAYKNNIEILRINDKKNKMEIIKRLDSLEPLSANLLRFRSQDLYAPKFIEFLTSVSLNGDYLIQKIINLKFMIDNDKYRFDETLKLLTDAKNSMLNIDNMLILHNNFNALEHKNNLINDKIKEIIYNKNCVEISNEAIQKYSDANNQLIDMKNILDGDQEILGPSQPEAIKDARKFWWPWGYTSQDITFESLIIPKAILIPGEFGFFAPPVNTFEKGKWKAIVHYETPRWCNGNFAVKFLYKINDYPPNKLQIELLSHQIANNTVNAQLEKHKKLSYQGKINSLADELQKLEQFEKIDKVVLEDKRRQQEFSIRQYEQELNILRSIIEKNELVLHKLLISFQKNNGLYQIVCDLINILNYEDYNFQIFKRKYQEYSSILNSYLKISLSQETDNKNQLALNHKTYKLSSHDTNEYWEIDVPADGSCLFYSVMFGYLLPVKNDRRLFEQRFKLLFGAEDGRFIQQTYDLFQIYQGETSCANQFKTLVNSGFRQKIVNFMQSNASLFKPYILDFEQYLLQMRKSITWGDQPELEAMSRFLKTQIFILQDDSNGLKPVAIHGNNFSDIIYLVRRNGNHYHYLINTEYLILKNHFAFKSFEENITTEAQNHNEKIKISPSLLTKKSKSKYGNSKSPNASFWNKLKNDLIPEDKENDINLLKSDDSFSISDDDSGDFFDSMSDSDEEYSSDGYGMH